MTDMGDVIRAHIGRIEREMDVRVLFACEAGSRAWGIESPDSDYDVRFIYRHRLDCYLSLAPWRDTIEHPFGPMAETLDLVGWDVRKALRLAGKSNPALLEWLASPIFYCGEGEWFRAGLRDIMADYSPRALMHHYVSLAARQHKAYWKPGAPVRLKKYFYAVRPLLAVLWMASHGHGLPWLRVDALLDGVVGRYRTLFGPDEVGALRTLLTLKRQSGEMADGRIGALDGFISAALPVCRSMAEAAPRREPHPAALDALFRATINAPWGEA
jgi:hypothetical protein